MLAGGSERSLLAVYRGVLLGLYGFSMLSAHLSARCGAIALGFASL